jgi:HEAT repeat protein
MSSRRAMDALVAALPELRDEALAATPALVGGLDPVAVRHLLDVLADAEDRRQRLRLLDLLTRLGPAVVGPAEAGLADPRWYVVRNMLLLLRRVGDARSLPAVRACAGHEDLRVRLEAIHCLFAFERTAPEALLGRAIHDPDARQAAAAVELAGQYRIAEAVGPLVGCLAARDPFGKRRPVRLAAIRALAAIGDPSALDGLAHFRARVPLLRPALEERRELYRTLAAYPEAARRPWIESGMRSGDGEIRRQSALLASGSGGAT